MEVPVSEAKGRLTELVRRAQAGEDVILTRHGQALVRFVPVKQIPDRDTRRRVLEEARRSGSRKATEGPDAAHSQHFLYSEDGLPT